jgi:hypothetical protein
LQQKTVGQNCRHPDHAAAAGLQHTCAAGVTHLHARSLAWQCASARIHICMHSCQTACAGGRRNRRGHQRS